MTADFYKDIVGVFCKDCFEVRYSRKQWGRGEFTKKKRSNSKHAGTIPRAGTSTFRRGSNAKGSDEN